MSMVRRRHINISNKLGFKIFGGIKLLIKRTFEHILIVRRRHLNILAYFLTNKIAYPFKALSILLKGCISVISF